MTHPLPEGMSCEAKMLYALGELRWRKAELRWRKAGRVQAHWQLGLDFARLGTGGTVWYVSTTDRHYFAERSALIVLCARYRR